MSNKQSSRWQYVASLSDEEFEAYIQRQFGRDEEATTAGAVKLAKRSQAQEPDPGTPETCTVEDLKSLAGHGFRTQRTYLALSGLGQRLHQA